MQIGLSCQAFNLVPYGVAGSIPVRFSIYSLGVAQFAQSPRFGTERSQVRILSPRPNFAGCIPDAAQLKPRNTRWLWLTWKSIRIWQSIRVNSLSSTFANDLRRSGKRLTSRPPCQQFWLTNKRGRHNMKLSLKQKIALNRIRRWKTEQDNRKVLLNTKVDRKVTMSKPKSGTQDCESTR